MNLRTYNKKLTAKSAEKHKDYAKKFAELFSATVCVNKNMKEGTLIERMMMMNFSDESPARIIYFQRSSMRGLVGISKDK